MYACIYECLNACKYICNALHWTGHLWVELLPITRFLRTPGATRKSSEFPTEEMVG